MSNYPAFQLRFKFGFYRLTEAEKSRVKPQKKLDLRKEFRYFFIFFSSTFNCLRDLNFLMDRQTDGYGS